MCLFSLLCCCCCYYCYSFFDKCLLNGVAPSASFHVLRRVEPNGRAQSHENCTKREHTNINLEVAIFTKIQCVQPYTYMWVYVYNDPNDILNRTHTVNCWFSVLKWCVDATHFIGRSLFAPVQSPYLHFLILFRALTVLSVCLSSGLLFGF